MFILFLLLLSGAWNRFLVFLLAMALPWHYVRKIVNGILHGGGDEAAEPKMQAAILGFHCRGLETKDLRHELASRQPAVRVSCIFFFGCLAVCVCATRVLGQILFL